jgi:hypothetical protein
MTETEYARKQDELDRLLNDPDVAMEPSLVWSLLAEISREATIADDISPDTPASPVTSTTVVEPPGAATPLAAR